MAMHDNWRNIFVINVTNACAIVGINYYVIGVLYIIL